MLPDKEIERIKENLTRQKKMNDLLTRTPEFQEQGRLFLNWVAHGSVLNVAGSLFDPMSGADYKNLVWKDSGLNVLEATDLLAEKVTEHAKETHRVHKELKNKHPELELISQRVGTK